MKIYLLFMLISAIVGFSYMPARRAGTATAAGDAAEAAATPATAPVPVAS